MKILKKLLMATVLIIVQAYALSASATLGYMRVSLIETELQIKTPEAGDWGYAAINTPLDVGDEVWVPEGGRAELQLDTGTYIRLDGGTALQILSLDQDSSQFYLSQGNVYIYYDAPRGSVIQVDTPDAATRVFDRAIFSLSISQYYTDVTVYKGYVVTENRVGETRVNAGNMVSLGPDTNGEVYSIGYLDDWERWNQARDERLYEVRESQSVRYLPSELRTYYSDFDSYGSWVHVNEYGYVWTPQDLCRRVGPHTAMADGYGGAAITSGSATSRGDGLPIITAGGLMPWALAGAGCRLSRVLFIGARAMLAGSGPVIMWGGCRWRLARSITAAAITAGTASTSPM